MNKQPYYITARELAGLGRDQIPPELISNTHLIYSSPATLSFNSPGAQGFGVKRAGLAIPGSVMLLVAPGCCGRNTTILSELGGYSDRFFYLNMDENDIVTGKHLRSIPQAVVEVCRALPQKPTVVMICITCVDALLGTDMERVCRKASEAAGLPVLPCYMYALTREGRKPPMVAVRQAIYSMLEPLAKRPDTVNLLGHFAPLNDDCELYDLLHQFGLKQINEISRCRSLQEYKNMAQANFNLILHPEVRLAAEEMETRLHIPSIELTRMYQLDKIKNQYHILARTLGTTVQDGAYYEPARQAVETFTKAYGQVKVAIGGMLNANSFELALALTRYGLTVREIYGNLAADDFVYIRKLAQLSPETRIYTNLSPTMLYYDCSDSDIDLTLGKDAEYYHPGSVNVPFNEERQPFGYEGVRLLFTQLQEALDQAASGRKQNHIYGSASAFAAKAAAESKNTALDFQDAQNQAEGSDTKIGQDQEGRNQA
jgi:nitrogenase molybdenum-cofactor synthesis protein NifE